MVIDAVGAVILDRDQRGTNAPARGSFRKGRQRSFSVSI
jgi:hypothetical protein